jgi:dihydroneopterin aldolase/2-amino-4-hydroxy-6-hydroxymethyldihydropteridine diphosphokinase
MTATTRIAVRGIRAHAFHGVYDFERENGQEFSLDIVCEIDGGRAAATDDVAHTLSYGEVARTARRILAGEPVDLLETLAERVAGAVLELGAQAVEVTVHKPEAPVGVAVDDVALTIRRERTPGVTDPALLAAPAAPVEVVLALGSNLAHDGREPRVVVSDAVGRLAHAEGVHVRAVSPLVRTAPVLADGQEQQPDYVNAVVLATTTLPAAEVLALAHRVEAGAGRVRRERWGARTLDVDVIAYGAVTSSDPVLTLPHPRAAVRAFVLVPWSLADPGAALPGEGGGPVATLAAAAPDREGLGPADEGWDPLAPGTTGERA